MTAARPMSWPPVFAEPVDHPYRTDATPAVRRFAALIEANEALTMARYLWRPAHFRPVLMKLAIAAGLPACANEEMFAGALAALDLRPVAAELVNPAFWGGCETAPADDGTTPLFATALPGFLGGIWAGGAS